MSTSGQPKPKSKPKGGPLKVAILMGGPSNERKISLTTGRVVKSYLDRTKYKVRTINIDDRGLWRRKITPATTDIVFNALHGRVGEDGQMQGYLDVVGVPYTGSGVLASALGMDKFVSRQLLMSAGIDVPSGLLLTHEPKDLTKIDLPAVVKPNSSGSSLGVAMAQTREVLARTIRKTLSDFGSILVEPLIRGRELTVPVLGNGKPKALPVIEIIPRGSKFFDYRNKYGKDGAIEETPARISNVMTQQVQNLAVRAHQVLDCRGYSRTDMILCPNGQIKVLEVNTLPGLTENSLLPKSAAAAGITFPDLLDRIISLAIE